MQEIGKQLRRSPSTISRELRRNAVPGGGFERKHAQRQSMRRRQAVSARPRIEATYWATVEARLREDWSPDQIANEGGCGDQP